MAISPIVLGNSSTNAGGTTILGGISSGLDPTSIINSLVSAQTAQVKTLQDQITVNNSQVSALSNLNQMLSQLQKDIAVLATPQSPNSSTNIFATRSVNVTSNTSVAASNYVTATASDNATVATYNITNISQIAKNTVQESNAFSIANADTSVVAASPTAGMFTAGTFTINGQNITLTAGETLNQVAAAFNNAYNASPSSGISASVFQTASGTFKLIMTGANTGAANAFDLNAFETNAVSVASPSAATNGEFTAGTYTVNGQSVNITSNESLNDIATAFNTSGAGVTATVVQVATGSYKIVFTGNTADLANNAASFDLATSNNITSGASALSNVLFTTDQTAQDAKFQFNGVSIQRSSNTVSDLVSGVTFNLLQDTTSQPGATISLAVTPNTTAIANAIQTFANDYNSFLGFYSQQTQVDSTTGVPATTAVLNSDTTLRGVFNQISNFAASVVAGLNSGGNTLQDIGISFADAPATSTIPATANELSIDGPTLLDAINNNISKVENIFGYNAVTSSTNLALFSGPTDPTISSFSVTVNQSGSTYTATYTDANNQQQTINLTRTALTHGFSLSAPSDSALAGLVMIYSGAGDESNISVTTTNGIASQMNTYLSNLLVPAGPIAVDQQAIQTKNTTTQTQITNINNQITTTRNVLLQKFSALEAAIVSANSSLNFLNAQQLATSGH